MRGYANEADRSEDDILHQLLLKLGLDLCVPIETRTIAGKLVRSIGAGTLVACLDEKIGGSDVAKTNCTVILHQHGLGNVRSIWDGEDSSWVRSISVTPALSWET